MKESIFKYNRYSSWSKILTIMGCMQTFCFSLKEGKPKEDTKQRSVIVLELLRVEKVFKKIHRQQFSDEYVYLKNKEVDCKKRKFQQLSPYFLLTIWLLQS